MTIVHLAVWNIDILISIMQDCKPFGRPDPRFPDSGNMFPAEWDAVLRRVRNLIPEVEKGKAQLGLPSFEPTISATGRN